MEYYYNIINTAMCPSAISKTQELQFCDECKMCHNMAL